MLENMAQLLLEKSGELKKRTSPPHKKIMFKVAHAQPKVENKSTTVTWSLVKVLLMSVTSVTATAGPQL